MHERSKVRGRCTNDCPLVSQLLLDLRQKLNDNNQKAQAVEQTIRFKEREIRKCELTNDNLDKVKEEEVARGNKEDGINIYRGVGSM